MPHNTVSLILPCYNESQSVEKVAKLLKQLSLNRSFGDTSLALETIVVNDGSTDTTKQLLDQHEVFHKVVHHSQNQGYGAAIKTGLNASMGGWVAFMDFDGTCDPADLFHLKNHAIAKNSDLVLGYRLHRDSEMPRTRRVGNTLYAWFLKVLFPKSALLGRHDFPKDVCTGFRLLKRECALELFHRLPNDLSFTPAMTSLALKKKFRLSQHPVRYVERLGVSKLSVVRDGFRFLFTILKFSLVKD